LNERSICNTGGNQILHTSRGVKKGIRKNKRNPRKRIATDPLSDIRTNGRNQSSTSSSSSEDTDT